MARGDHPRRDPVSFWKALCFYAGLYRDQRAPALWSFVFHIFTLLPQMVMPVLVKVMVDQYIPAQDTAGIYATVAIMGVLLVLNVLFATAERATFSRIVKVASRELRNRIVRRLQMLSLSSYHAQETGRYYSKIMVDVERTEQFANVFINNILTAGLLLTVMVAILAVVNARVLLILMVIFPLMVLLARVFKSSVRRSRHYERLAREDLSSTISTFLQTSLLARLHGHEPYEREKVDSTSAVVVEKSTEAEAQVGLFSALVTAANLGMHIGVLAYAACEVIDGNLTIGEMMLFVTYVAMMRQQFMQIINVIPVLAVFTEAVSSIREILEAPDLEYNQGKQRLTALEGAVEFDRVSFAYDDGKYALRDVSVAIPARTTVALVGPSGSGKSTFVNLLLGLYRTGEGIVSIDGTPIDALDMQQVRRLVGVVNQDPILFTGTVYENIVHAYQDVPLAQVISAARKAHAHDFIMEMKDGYNAEVGEGGVLFSGGQRQRIALARTILREPSILVLDEATSALDSVSERLVQGAIEELTGQVTTFIIAHRLSTITHADLILVFKDGRIVERGRHDELAAIEGGVYAELLAHQVIAESEPEPATAQS